jgi:uncharacterized membrane protein YagU involved in acid resistance
MPVKARRITRRRRLRVAEAQGHAKSRAAAIANAGKPAGRKDGKKGEPSHAPRQTGSAARHRSGPRLAITVFMFKGIVAGAIGGLVGTWAMSEVQRGWTRVIDGGVPESAGGKHDARDWQERSERQNSNELAAQALGSFLIGRCLTREELRFAAPLMHYSFGAALGAVYGAYSERRRTHASGAGFGTTVWLAADEIAMPLLGLSDATTRRPLEMHLQSLFAHLVFGAVTEMARRVIRAQSEAAMLRAA